MEFELEDDFLEFMLTRQDMAMGRIPTDRIAFAQALEIYDLMKIGQYDHARNLLAQNPGCRNPLNYLLKTTNQVQNPIDLYEPRKLMSWNLGSLVQQEFSNENLLRQANQVLQNNPNDDQMLQQQEQAAQKNRGKHEQDNTLLSF